MSGKVPVPGRSDESRIAYTEQRREHWDRVARDSDRRPGFGGGYHRRLARVYRNMIPPGQRVLELGCGTGDLLAAVAPSEGVGIDFSSEMVARARSRHPSLRFFEMDVHDLALDQKFDYVIASDLFNDLWDIQGALERVFPLCHSRTRILANSYSRLWEAPLLVAQSLGLARPVLGQNWVTTEDVKRLFELSGFQPLRSEREVLWPLRTPLVDDAFNRFVVKIWPFGHFALTNFVVARPAPAPTPDAGRALTVSVVVPARDEEGNIAPLLARVPEMGAGTEIVFVEGHSRDATRETIARAIRENPSRRWVLLEQTGKGKGDAVRAGFARAGGDVLMILDADLTVAPEDLPRFFDALVSGKGDLINGVRLVYPLEKEAMRFFNLLGNKFFSQVFTSLLGQPVKDTLCGTKVLLRSDYERIAARRSDLGDFDPFGDFDLLFGAARQGLRILDLPVRYRSRTYGRTSIQRWRHGLLLLRMAGVAARKIKFV